MDFWEWQETYLVNIDIFDEHHKYLLALLNNLYRDVFACTDPTQKQLLIEHLLTELIDYTYYHFAAEENLLLQYEYPDYALHKQQHDTFKVQLHQLMEQHKDGSLVWSFPIFVFLKDWISLHILNADQQYAPYLNEKI